MGGDQRQCHVEEVTQADPQLSPGRDPEGTPGSLWVRVRLGGRHHMIPLPVDPGESREAGQYLARLLTHPEALTTCSTIWDRLYLEGHDVADILAGQGFLGQLAG